LGETRDFGLHEGETIACFLNSSHDLGLNQILSTFFSGATLVMHKLIFMIDFVRLLEEHEVAGFTAVPSFWHLMMSARVWPLELPKLRYVTVSGGSLEPAAWRWLRQALPHVDIIKTYGQTETFRSLLRHGPPAEGEEHFDSLGFPIQGVDLSLKESGELIHRGAGTMLGYYGAELISPDRGVETGDIFVFDSTQGYRFRGRRDDMMKINGHRIYPSQLERFLMEHPAVVEAMVSVVGAEVGVDRLVAVVAAADGSGVSTATLQGFMADRVPRGLVPSHVLIRDRLPKTSSGKVDRMQLTQDIHSFLFKKTNV
jgi:acyl-coenzyme A synthetase/AMP-(fatty) acid ligase